MSPLKHPPLPDFLSLAAPAAGRRLEPAMMARRQDLLTDFGHEDWMLRSRRCKADARLTVRVIL